MKRRAGFTLIELMIVVGLIGILAAVAMVAYQNQVRTTKAAKVSAHYRVATDYVKWQFANAHVRVSQGMPPDPPIPDTSAGWVALIDWESMPAPGGGPAYVPGAGDPSTGAIGISVTGTWADFDSAVTVTQPAYGGLTTQSMVIHALGSY